MMRTLQKKTITKNHAAFWLIPILRAGEPLDVIKFDALPRSTKNRHDNKSIADDATTTDNRLLFSFREIFLTLDIINMLNRAAKDKAPDT